MSNIPDTWVAPNRFLVLRSTLNPRSGSPSRYSTTSTMCSSILGPASPPSLVTWPTSTTDTPVVLASRTSRAALSRTCGDATGRGTDLGHTHGLDGVDDQQSGAVALGECNDCVDVVVGDQAYRLVADPEATRPHRDLIRRLFGAGHHHRIAPAGEGAGQLEEERRLSDARLPAQEQHRSCHHAAAQHAVDLPPTGRLLRSFDRSDADTRPMASAALTLVRASPTDLGQRLARPALRAKTHPFGRFVPAGLASKCHNFSYFG